MIETSYQAETDASFVAPQAGGFGLNVPASPAPTTGRQIAGLDWRQTGEVCPQTAVHGLVPTSVPNTKARMADVRVITAFDNKQSVPGLSAWSPPV